MDIEDPAGVKPNKNSLAVISWTDKRSLLMNSTIPIFQLHQTSSQTISNQTAVKQLNIDIATSNSTSSIEATSIQGGNWSNSIFKPAASSSFSTTKRRECKSTSDENYVHELKTEVASMHLEPNDFSVSMMSGLVKKRLSGQFGFNPGTVQRKKISRLMGTSSSSDLMNNASMKSFKTSLNKEKKGVKRLGSSMAKFKHLAVEQINHNKKLFHLVSNGEFVKVRDLLDTNMHDVNCCDDKQRTCLHIASARGSLEIVRLLLDYGANPNIRDCVSNLPIHLAIISSHVPVVTLLLEAGTDIHSLDLNGKTVLHLAGTRLRWLLNEENHKASPKLKYEAIMIMDMIKQYLRRKKASVTDLDMLADRLENVISLDDMSSLDDILNQFDTLNIQTNIQNRF